MFEAQLLRAGLNLIAQLLYIWDPFLIPTKTAILVLVNPKTLVTVFPSKSKAQPVISALVWHHSPVWPSFQPWPQIPSQALYSGHLLPILSVAAECPDWLYSAIWVPGINLSCTPFLTPALFSKCHHPDPNKKLTTIWFWQQKIRRWKLRVEGEIGFLLATVIIKMLNKELINEIILRSIEVIQSWLRHAAVNQFNLEISMDYHEKGLFLHPDIFPVCDVWWGRTCSM